MRRLLSRGLPAILLAAALTVPPLSPAAAAASDEPTRVTAVDFSDGTTGQWTRSGGTDRTLSVIDLDGNKVLQVADRDADYVGIQSPAGIFTPGETYHFSMRARLAPGTSGDASIRFVMKPAYAWIGNTTISADGWSDISADYTVPADATASDLQVYLGTSDASAPYTYLIDDILITTKGGTTTPTDPDVVGGGAISPTTTPVSKAQGTGNVSALTFDDGPNGATTEALLDMLKERDIHATFCVIGQNIQAPGGADILRRMVSEGHTLCNHSTSYADMGSWSAEQVRADLVENLRIIRTALNDPNAMVPFFRAPNGSWGQTPAVAVSLGMQPLAVTGTIADWEVSDPAVLTENLRNAMTPGNLVLVHDGGGNRMPSLQATTTVVDERLAAGWTFSLPEGAPTTVPGPGTVLIDTTFDDNSLDGWSARQGGDVAPPTVSVVTPGASGTAFAAQVSDRIHEGDGIQRDVTGLLLPGSTYRFEGSVRFAEGTDPGRGLSLSMRTESGGTPNFANLIQIENATSTGWTAVSGQFTVPSYDTAAELYIEARYSSGNLATFLVDQLRVSVPEAGHVDTSLTPLKDTTDFPVGVAIDSRETTGAASELLLHHFSQVTPENHMKVEAWYDSEHRFARNTEATRILDYAQQNKLRTYGHVLLWHSQTPDWFFQDDSGRELTSSPEDKQLLRDRLAVHIDDVARSIADDYGLYGSAGNPIVAWDVVNEVIADQATSDGLRTSRWYQVLGEEYIGLAFRLADEAFNGTYAAPGTDRPVKLFINDYNTEQDVKGAQYRALVDRLLASGTPIDGVGHQFHVSINTPVAALEGALDRFAGLGLLQEVTEFDVTINPATQPNLIRQGYFYQDAFALFRKYHAEAPASEKLFAVTIWGLTDNRSWRSEQMPLMFDGTFGAKPAYFGAVGGQLPSLVTTANVFGGDVELAPTFVDDLAWRTLPSLPLTNDAGSFTLRWSDDHLTALVRTRADVDTLAFTYGGAEHVYRSGVTGSLAGIDTVNGGERLFAVRLPHSGVTIGATAGFDVRALSGDTVRGAWNTPGATGTLTFLEAVSYLEIPHLEAPAIDGTIDPVWEKAAHVRTERTVEGNDAGATADVRTLWQGNRLYVLFDVADPELDLTNSDPWGRDSVELFLDLGNQKNGSYGPNDTQIRVTADGELSFGTGSAAAQRARVLSSATQKTDTGYVVELEIDLVGQSGGQSDVPLGGQGTFHGIDFQVNDARSGSRFSVKTWAEPTGTGYQNTARWGVAQLGEAPVDPTNPTDAWAKVDVGSGTVQRGGSLPVTVSGLQPGQQIEATLHSDPIHVTGIPSADAQGKTSFAIQIPADFELGAHTLVVSSGDLDPISVAVTVVPAGDVPGTGGQQPGTGGHLPNSGGQFAWGMALLAAILLAGGGLLTVTRRRNKA